MSEVRRHQRVTASGKRTTVRQHHRDAGGGGADDQPPGTWFFRNREDGGIYAVHPDGSTHRLPPETEEQAPAPHVSELRAAEPEPQAQGWWDEDERYRQRAEFLEAHPDAAALLADEQLDRDSVAADEAAQRMIAERTSDEPQWTRGEPARDYKLSDPGPPNPARDV